MQVVLQDIRKYFGQVKANDGISITLEPGKVYGLLGENGAGKSTLMKILSGYHQPDAGQVVLNTQAVSFSSPADALLQGVGMIYQDPLDIPAMRVLDNYLLGWDKKVRLAYARAREDLLQAAAKLGFQVDTDAYIDTLTLGERQQLELLRLLALGAEVLILDEPTTGISAEQKESLFSSIRTLVKEEDKAVILVSHKLSDIQELCDHVFVLRKGKLVGTTEIPCPTQQLVQMMFEELPPRREKVSHVREQSTLEMQAVGIESDRLIVQNIDLQVREGEVFGLAGLEGSGQKLLLQACAGLVRPSAGKIFLNGQDVTRWPYHRMLAAGIAYLPAGRLEEGLVSGLSLIEHVALASPESSFIIDWPSFTLETQERINRYQVVGRPESRVETLSGGNQQRSLFALLQDDLKLLLLEHPTRGLDVRSAEWIWQLLIERVQDGTAIIFMSADLDELSERSDRIAAFSGGAMSRVVDASETSAEELGHLIGGE
jgi:simple sugar transport system ATP-binding protein